jgi:hypothetical protein
MTVLVGVIAGVGGWAVAGADRGPFASPSAHADDADGAVEPEVRVVLDGPAAGVAARVATIGDGDRRIVFERDGDDLLTVVDRRECAGRSDGLAEVERTEHGFRVKGILAAGATGVWVTVPDGSLVEGRCGLARRCRTPTSKLRFRVGRHASTRRVWRSPRGARPHPAGSRT